MVVDGGSSKTEVLLISDDLKTIIECGAKSNAKGSTTDANLFADYIGSKITAT